MVCVAASRLAKLGDDRDSEYATGKLQSGVCVNSEKFIVSEEPTVTSIGDPKDGAASVLNTHGITSTVINYSVERLPTNAVNLTTTTSPASSSPGVALNPPPL
jgi:hypothetical protein